MSHWAKKLPAPSGHPVSGRLTVIHAVDNSRDCSPPPATRVTLVLHRQIHAPLVSIAWRPILTAPGPWTISKAFSALVLIASSFPLSVTLSCTQHSLTQVQSSSSYPKTAGTSHCPLALSLSAVERSTLFSLAVGFSDLCCILVPHNSFFQLGLDIRSFRLVACLLAFGLLDLASCSPPTCVSRSPPSRSFASIPIYYQRRRRPSTRSTHEDSAMPPTS